MVKPRKEIEDENIEGEREKERDFRNSNDVGFLIDLRLVHKIQ